MSMGQIYPRRVAFEDTYPLQYNNYFTIEGQIRSLYRNNDRLERPDTVTYTPSDLWLPRV
jgi:hypothetical protein